MRSRAVWSPRAASRILLPLLVRAFASTGPLVFGIDATIERRRGRRIRARGIYRDPVHSSHAHCVKASGLRWLSVMLLSTDLALTAADVVGYFIRRWQVEVTFEEARRPLGLETQRQWSDRAIARTTPMLLGLFSLVTLLAARLVRDGRLPVRTPAWYAKRGPTFSDALATVRRQGGAPRLRAPPGARRT